MPRRRRREPGSRSSRHTSARRPSVHPMSPHLMLGDGPLSAAGSAAPSVLVLRCLQPSFASVCNGWLLHVGGAFLGIWYNRWCTYYQFLLRCFYLSSLRAGSCGGCYFVLRTSRAQFHGTEQLVVCVCAQLTTISLWAAHSKCGVVLRLGGGSSRNLHLSSNRPSPLPTRHPPTPARTPPAMQRLDWSNDGVLRRIGKPPGWFAEPGSAESDAAWEQCIDLLKANTDSGYHEVYIVGEKYQAKVYVSPGVQRNLGSFALARKAAEKVLQYRTGQEQLPQSPATRRKRGEGRMPRYREAAGERQRQRGWPSCGSCRWWRRRSLWLWWWELRRPPARLWCRVGRCRSEREADPSSGPISFVWADRRPFSDRYCRVHKNQR